MKSSLRLFVGFSFGTWINALINLVSIPVITWLVNPVEFGKATMFTIAHNLVINIVLLGSDQSFVRLYNEKENDVKKLLFNSSIISPLIFSVFLGLAILSFKEKVSVALFSGEDYTSAVYALIISLFIGILSRFGTLLIRMKSRAMEYSVVQILAAVGNIIFVISYATYIHPSFEGIVYGFIFSLIITLIVTIYLEQAFWIDAIKRFVKVDKELVSQVLIYGLPFVPTFLVDWIFQSSDRALLRVYSTYTEIGLFAAATKVANSLNIIKNGFTAYWVPLSYQHYLKNAGDTEMYKKYFNLLSLIFFSAVIILTTFSDIILYLLPESYRESSKIFPILLFVPLLYTLSEITVVGINFKKKPFWHLLIVIVSALTNLIGGFFLIPKFGALGAGISTLIAYLVFFFMRSFISVSLYPVTYDWDKFIFALFLSLGVLIVHVFFEPNYLAYVFIFASVISIVLIYIKDFQMVTSKLFQ